MNRITKLSLLSKEREYYYQNLPDSNGEKELRLLCDVISGWVIAGINVNTPTSRHQITNSKELSSYINSLLGINIPKENIERVRSLKKSLLIKSNKKVKSYKQRF